MQPIKLKEIVIAFQEKIAKEQLQKIRMSQPKHNVYPTVQPVENKQNTNPLKIRKYVTKVDNNMFEFECPHCNGTVQVEESAVACRIFRHATFKQPNNPQIPPHTPKEECEKLVAQNLVNGCAKPFMFYFAEPQNYVEACDYI